MSKIIVNVELCTGCQICTLACSYMVERAFNPRNAKVVVHQNLSGLVYRIEFLDSCDIKIANGCSKIDHQPPCVDLCCFTALQFERRDKNGSNAINTTASRNWE